MSEHNSFAACLRPRWYNRKQESWCPSKESPLLSYKPQQTQGGFRVYCQSRKQKELQEDKRPPTANKKTAETLEIFNCKHAWLTKDWDSWKLSTFWIWLPCETFTSHRIISPSFLPTLWTKRRDGPGSFVETQCFIFKIWKPNIIGDTRSSRWTTLSK